MEIGTDTTARIAAATLGDRITSRLLDTGLSAAELARFVGVTSEAVSQWESGETEDLKPENLVQTAEFLATTERWLTFGRDARCDLQGRIREAPYPIREQTGRRPVIELSHDAFNKVPTWRSVIVVPVSSSLRQAGRVPTAVSLAAGVGGLERDGVAVCHQVTTLDRGKLTERIGHIPVEVIAKIEDGLKAALGMV